MTETDPTQLYATGYNRGDCQVGLVHLGYGAFHRAHQAVYMDDLLGSGVDLSWGIAAVNLRTSDREQFRQASSADQGYLLKTNSSNGRQNYRLVRSHLAFADWSIRPREAEALLAKREVNAVTMTVTESGYSLNGDHSIDLDDRIIVNELNGGAPSSIYGYLANAVALRAEAIDKPITFICCDNIRANGTKLKTNFLAYLEAAKLSDLASWVKTNVTFPRSMVDRITPRSDKVLKDEICSLFPSRNLQPVHAEEFCQWVLEDAFAGPMPQLGNVGVEIVRDVDPYEEAKIRILNGGHTGLAYLGALAGHRTFDEAMLDPEIRRHYDEWQQLEVLPGLTRSLPFDKGEYLAVISSRFENQNIADQLERICMDGFSKMPIYIRPTLEGCLEQGITPYRGYDCVASWVVFARRWAAGKMPIRYREPFWSELKPFLEPGIEERLACHRQLWGDLPEMYGDFVSDIVVAIKEMEKKWPV